MDWIEEAKERAQIKIQEEIQQEDLERQLAVAFAAEEPMTEEKLVSFLKPYQEVLCHLLLKSKVTTR